MKKSIKLLSLALAAIMLLTLVPVSVFAETGTEDTAATNTGAAKPISTAAEFMAMEANGTYYLTNDIDFSSVCVEGSEPQSLVSGFSGVLDGRGFSLLNVKLKWSYGDDKDQHCGIFRTLAYKGNVVIKNLNVGTEDNHATILVPSTAANAKRRIGFLGGITDETYGVVFENVNVYGDIDIDCGGTNAENSVGGFIGYNRTSVVAINCTMTGYIDATGIKKKQARFGGMIGQNYPEDHVGTYEKACLFYRCVNNANLTSESMTDDFSCMGGLVGEAYMSGFTFIECVNNGNLSGGSGSYGVGGILGNQKRSTLFAKDCLNTGTIVSKGAPTGDIVGTNQLNTTWATEEVSYQYIKNCLTKDAETNENIPTSQNTVTTAISDLDGLKSMVNDGVYVLANDIDLGGESFTNSVIPKDFSGVLDGDGHKIYNFSVSGEGDVGFFNGLCYGTDLTADTAATLITDLTIGAADNHAEFSTTGNGTNIGALSAKIGTGTEHATNFLTTLYGVTVYADITSTGGSVNAGGIAGQSTWTSYANCNFYGSITATGSGEAVVANVGGLAGKNEGFRTLFYNNTNYGAITNNVTATANADTNVATAGGLVGTAITGNVIIMECENLNEVKALATQNFANVTAGGFVGLIGTDFATIVNSANVGNITSGGNAAATACATCSTNISNFINFGAISSKKAGDDVYSHLSATETTFVNKYDCVNETVIDMTGAAVKLSDPTGLRFGSKVSADGIAALNKILGEGEYTVKSYGTIIAPNPFAEAAIGFVHGAMDTFGAENDFGEAKAYVDVVMKNNAWFGGEEGKIAGSIVNLNASLYDVEFIGRAYMTVDFNGATLTLYSDTVVRSLVDVANAALNDTLYLKDGVYYELNDGVYTVYDKADKVDYDNTLETVEGGYEKLSPYNAAEREYLTSLVSASNAQ